MNYYATANNVHIEDSYQVSKRAFRSILEEIRLVYPDCLVWQRNTCSLCFEWATHNALYCLGLFRSHTKDVDLNWPQKWYVTALYNVVGVIVWPFIR